MSLVRVPVIKRGRMIWDQNRLPRVELDERIAKLRRIAEEKNLSGVVVYGNPLKSGDMCYFTNYACHIAWRDGFFILPSDTEKTPVLLLKVAARDVPYIQETTPIKVQACGNLASVVNELLDQKEMTQGNLGFVGNGNVPYILLKQLHTNLPQVQWLDLTKQVNSWREIKSKNEQLLIEESACLTAKAFDYIKDHVMPGVALRSLQAKADYLVRMEGCEDFQMLAGINENGLGPVSDYVLQQGDTLQLFLAVQHLKYWSSMSRTLHVGQKDSFEMEGVLSAEKLQSDIVKALVPADFDLARFRALLSGLPSTFGLGEGIGLELEEAPDLLKREFRPLAGMTLSLRIRVQDKNRKFLHGDTILLRQEDAKLLTAE